MKKVTYLIETLYSIGKILLKNHWSLNPIITWKRNEKNKFCLCTQKRFLHFYRNELKIIIDMLVLNHTWKKVVDSWITEPCSQLIISARNTEGALALNYLMLRILKNTEEKFWSGICKNTEEKFWFEICTNAFFFRRAGFWLIHYLFSFFFLHYILL